MRSLAVLALAVFMLAILPQVYADTNVDPSKDPQRECLVSYLECKETCSYHADSAQATSCERDCGQKYHCRPDAKQHAVRSLYDE